MEAFRTQLLFEINIEGVEEMEFHQERYIISAASAGEAYRYAMEKGKSQSENFVNTRGHLVCWRFLCVSSLEKLTFENNMAHIWDKTIQPMEPLQFLNIVKEKAGKLSQSYLYPAIN